MADIGPILVQERRFQKRAVAVGLAIAAVTTLALSNGRAMFGPFEQMAAAVSPVAPPAAAAVLPFDPGQPLGGGGTAGAVAPGLPGNVGGATGAFPQPGGLLPPGAAPAQLAQAAPDPGLPPGTGVAPGDVPGGQPSPPGGGGSGGPIPGSPGSPGPGGGGTSPLNPGPTDPGPVDPGPVDPGPNVPEPTAPIPEPLSWMMMVLGIGMIGGTLRLARRRQSAVSAEPLAA